MSRKRKVQGFLILTAAVGNGAFCFIKAAELNSLIMFGLGIINVAIGVSVINTLVAYWE